VYSEARVKHGGGVGWQRSGENICYYQNTIRRQTSKIKRNKRGGDPASDKPLSALSFSGVRKNDKFFYTLTFTIECHYSNDTVYMAHCYPFTYTDLKRHIGQISYVQSLQLFCNSPLYCDFTWEMYEGADF
jgi:cytosolic carboxypeptidase protein 2/3